MGDTNSTNPSQPKTDGKSDDSSLLTPETIEFAHRMFDTAREGNAEVLLAAVDAGLPVNLTNPKGNSLLMIAAYAGHTELVRSLLARGADLHRINDMGQSIVGAAVYKGYGEIVKSLIEAGADPRSGRPTAIELAGIFKRKEMFELLGVKEGDLDRVPPELLASELGRQQPASS